MQVLRRCFWLVNLLLQELLIVILAIAVFFHPSNAVVAFFATTKAATLESFGQLLKAAWVARAQHCTSRARHCRTGNAIVSLFEQCAA